MALLTLAPGYRMVGDTVRLTRVGPGLLQLRLGGPIPATLTISDSAARAFATSGRAYLARKRVSDDCEMPETPDTTDVEPQLLGRAARGGSVTGIALRCDPPGPDGSSAIPARFTVVALFAAPDENGAMGHDLTLYASGSALRAFLLKVERLVSIQKR